MNVLNQERIRRLVRHRASPCVSLFMPTHRTGRERQQDTIRLKNLLTQAHKAMRERGESMARVEKILEPLYELRMNEEFWRHRSDGLACFCAPDFHETYRVPLEVKEQLFINDRFHVRPLLPLLRYGARILVLALSQDSARLVEATRDSVREIDLPGVRRPEVDADRRAVQYHSHQAPTQGRGANEEAVFHGQGKESDRAKKETQQYLHRVAHEVDRVLKGQTAPLVLACVGYLAPLYESANTYPHLIQAKVPGSPDRWNDAELRDRAWDLVEPYFRQRQQKAWDQFEQVNGNDLASDDLGTVVLAADQGRIDTLFLAEDEQRWGHVDRESQAVHLGGDQGEGEELLDYAAMMTLSNGGEVFVLDRIPDRSAPAAATFRY